MCSKKNKEQGDRCGWHVVGMGDSGRDEVIELVGARLYRVWGDAVSSLDYALWEKRWNSLGRGMT